MGSGGALARSAGATLLARVVGVMLSALFVVLLARLLEVGEYGRYVYLISIATVFAMLADSGVPGAIGPRVARGEHSARQALVMALPIVVITGALFGIALAVFGMASFEDSLDGAALAATAAVVLVNPMLGVVYALLRCTGRAVVEGMIVVGAGALYVATGLAAAALGFGVDALMVLFLAQQAGALLVGWRLLGPSLRDPEATAPPAPGSRRSLLATSIVMGLGLILMAGYARLSLLVLANVGDERETGLFSAATRISEVGVMLGLAIGMALLPGIAWLSLEQRPRARRVVVWSALGAAGAAAVAGAALAVWPAAIVSGVFGDDYADASSATRVLGIGLPFFVLGPLMIAVLLALEEGRWMLWAHLTGAVVAVLAVVLLIPDGGLGAAATATVLPFIGVALVGALGLWASGALSGEPPPVPDAGIVPRARLWGSRS